MPLKYWLGAQRLSASSEFAHATRSTRPRDCSGAQRLSDGRKRHERDEAELQSELYQQIGQLKVELDWVKKKAGLLG